MVGMNVMTDSQFMPALTKAVPSKSTDGNLHAAILSCDVCGAVTSSIVRSDSLAARRWESARAGGRSSGEGPD